MIEYICPECGAKVNVLCRTILPSIYRYKCSKCSYEYEERSDITQKVITPIPMMTLTKHYEFTARY